MRTSSRLSLAMIAAGVPAGATTPYHPATTKPGMPASIIVGSCDAADARLALVTASGRNLPAAMCPWDCRSVESRKVRIDPSVMADPEMAEDLIAAAFNDAVNKVNAESQSRMSAATAGMPIPPGMKMPF